jgi:O-acetyl-ADP-ribose deacetylase (regulator of RNase III)
VIHTVGPVWRGGDHNEDALLASCYRNSLALARQHGLRTIAFPAISTGIYGFPRERAAHIAVAEVMGALAQSELPEQVTFVCHDPETRSFYEAALTPPRA